MKNDACPYADARCNHARNGEREGSLSQRGGRCFACQQDGFRKALGLGERPAKKHLFVGTAGENV